jgi:ADP-ribose pyrophosphatase YjhB (NUDIX family)
MNPKWLEWTRRLQAVAQTGLHFAGTHYEVERYSEVREIAAEMLAAGGGDPQSFLELLGRDSGYATPKVAVWAAAFRDHRILLVRNREDGCWSMPGGWADVGDTPSRAVEREICEESGFRARAVKVMAVYDRDRQGHSPLPWHVYKVFFLCEILGGEPSESEETDGVGFFAEDDLPPLSAARLTRAQVARAFAHHRDSGLPTEFD